MLPSARRRRDETAAREAAGENLWTNEFDQRALVRISEVWGFFDDANLELGDRVGVLLRGQVGWEVGGRIYPGFITGQTNDEIILDAIAAVRDALSIMQPYDGHASAFEENINAILREHRIAHKFVEGELIPFESDELLQETVEPALRLMVGDTFKAAHASYMDALREIGHGKPDDAITDATTALQEALTALGCDGHSLGPLIKNAKKNGHLGNHDQTLIDGIEKMMHWASADRSELGDGHKYSDAEIADAWLTVHVVGALIVRLADPDPRGSTE